MYRILVFSDSHGHTDYITSAIERIPADLIVHLGDKVYDIEKVSYIYDDLSFEYVSGNCDFDSYLPSTKIIEAEGFRILLTHGHPYNVKQSLLSLKSYAIENNVDCILYGHTHISECSYENGMLILNPGSGSVPGDESFGVIEIEGGKIKGCIIT